MKPMNPEALIYRRKKAFEPCKSVGILSHLILERNS
jgi:hypothetical protein